MRQQFFAGVVLCVLCGVVSMQATAQVSDLGKQLDRGVNRLSSEIQETWAEARQAVERMGLEGRVYARLHWDKALRGATLEIAVRDSEVVVLKGSVPSQEAKEKAVQLAGDTVGVSRVVDNLAVKESASR
jgi:osmotically-inducible protein OsmY